MRKENSVEMKLDSEVLQKIIVEAIPKLLAEKLSSSYSNPISAVLDAEIKEMSGEIRIFVKSLLSNVLTKPEFKEKIADILIAKIIQNGLKN